MIARAGSGWQTTTADLALILFLVVSAVSVDRGGAQAQHAAAAATPSLEASPSAAVYRATTGTSLAEWLRTQATDDRQLATVLVRRATAGPSPVVEQGLAFLDQIEASGLTGRLLVEPGKTDEVTVVLAYDRGPGSGMALAGQ